MTIAPETYKNYLHDLGLLCKEEALLAKSEQAVHRDNADEAYYTGYLMAWQRVISLMQQQAAAFEISQADINLEDLNPVEDLLPKKGGLVQDLYLAPTNHDAHAGCDDF